MNTIYRDSFTGDANKGITKIEYDLLGIPKKISFADRSYIDYVYSADGRRIKTRHFTAVPSSTTLSLGQESNLTSSQIQSVDSTEYIGDFVFENNTFKQYHFDGGYITSSGFPTNYKYYVKDHLGNNRILASYNGTVEQTTHYYPFGGTHHFSSNQGVQKYKYNDKELDMMHGLNMYDYGARQYDPAIGQFTTVDPLCEKSYHISPYAYCGGNPVNRVDPTGMDWFEFDRLGRMTITENKKEDKIIVNNPNKINYENDDNTDFGEFTWELTLPYGTINSCNSGEKDGYAILEVNGNTASTQLFNFLGKATDVEWSELKPSNLDGINYLSTSHETDRESGMNSLLSDKHLSDVKEFNHTHPNGHSEPSGTKDNKEYGKAGTYGDIAFGLYWSKKYPNASFNILIPSSGEVNNYNNYLNMFK